MIGKILRYLRISVSTLFFLGYIPFISGTIGSLVSIGVLWCLRDFLSPFISINNAHILLISLIILTLIAVFFCSDSEALFQSDDPKPIILDEFIGQLFTFYLFPLNWEVLLMGFCLFRFFDIVKPYPIYLFEKLDNGLGIVMDDVVAGLYSNISLYLILTSYHAIRSYL